ncbi:nucleotide exchange factor GrpE [Nonomuraea aurantiaca]|uniref:nucleotide exchange factor GrpE n=1 Tax=Nonomuraea aurantiaca TaxID=2878562 RepID=UPI001CDA38DD|nr:nucleotide exchange factor GrpE [Nonomuraea aurantiaca]MCA2226022.1 nucleotide exchange factor GrpE [Nonomuraea aurantiaca]
MNGHEDRTDPAEAPARQAPGAPAKADTPTPPNASVGASVETDAAAETNAKLAELEDRWLRSVAELDNVRKRIARDAERLRAEERDRVAAEWLPILDNLELALGHAAVREADARTIAEGVRAVRDQALAVLSRLGYARHDESDVPFDPVHHEAVATVERDDVAPGTVVQVVRPGYGDGQRQLRPAVVVVSKKAE